MMKTITGTWRDPSGQLVAYGKLHLKLNQDALIVGTEHHVAPREVSFPLDMNGSLPPGSRVWSNDELTPLGTYYTASVTTFGGGTVWGPSMQVIQGSDGQGSGVSSFAGRTGDVIPQASDYAAFFAPIGSTGGGFATFGINTVFVSQQPSESESLLQYIFAFPMAFPSNFSSPSSYAASATAATAAAVFSVQLNGSNVGSVTFNPSGPATFQTAGFSTNPGDRLSVFAPSVMDATLTYPTITLVGTRS